MSEADKPFLSRWSRLKAENRQRDLKADATQDANPQPTDDEQQKTEAAPFDPKAFELPIPDLDQIVAGFDMRPFLQKGVPESLKNAALRKLWHIDPAITGFVSPALDYAHDYNKLDSIAGFGALTDDRDLTELMGNLFSTGKNEPLQPKNETLAPVSPLKPIEKPEENHIPTQEEAVQPPQAVSQTEPIPVQNEHITPEPLLAKTDIKPKLTRHGSALPE
jgi:hypothetical protein